MKENTYEVRCTYCGSKKDDFNDRFRCDCGGEWRWEKVDGGYYFWEYNNVDNILEDKRGGRYSSK